MITEILVDMLAHITFSIISPQHSAFVKGIQNSYCIMAMSKYMNVLDTRIYDTNLAIKFDIRRAFDTLEWPFLLDVLRALGFRVY